MKKQRAVIGGIGLLVCGVALVLVAVWSGETWLDKIQDLLRVNADDEIISRINALRSGLIYSSVLAGIATVGIIFGIVTLLATFFGKDWDKGILD